MSDLIDRQVAIVTAVRAAIDWHKLANPQYSIAYCIGEAMRALPSAQPEDIARDIATIIENEKDMRVIERNAQQWIPCSECERRCDKWEDSKI